MSKRFANLSERLSADLPKDPTRPDEDEEDDCNADQTEGKKEKEKPMAENTVTADAHAKAIADTTSAATAAANARYNAVLGSEHYQGREALAVNLLGNAEMSSDAIISALATSPKANQAVDEQGDKEAGERADLRKNLADNQPQSLGAEGGDAPKADDAEPMLKAAATVNAINGHK